MEYGAIPVTSRRPKYLGLNKESKNNYFWKEYKKSGKFLKCKSKFLVNFKYHKFELMRS